MAEKGLSSSASQPGDIFDPKKLRRLVELMNEHDLGEIDLRDGDVRVRIRKHGESVMTAVEPRIAAPAARPAPAPTTGGSAEAPAKDDANVAVIKSPMVGTFFASSSPESPAFVKVGDHISRESTVCIIEAMKVFNEIPAEVSGKVVAVLVENGAPVEYGQPLFKVDTRK